MHLTKNEKKFARDFLHFLDSYTTQWAERNYLGGPQEISGSLQGSAYDAADMNDVLESGFVEIVMVYVGTIKSYDNNQILLALEILKKTLTSLINEDSID